MRAGSSASIFSRTRRATTGEVPPVPTATTTSPRSTIAGKMKLECSRSSITLTGRPSALARTDIATPTSPAPAQTTAMTPARSAVSGSPFAISIRAASAELSREILIAVDRMQADARTGSGEHAQLGAQKLTRSDQDHRTGLEIEEHRQEPHAILASPTSGVDWNYFLYMCRCERAKRKLFLLFCTATIEFSPPNAKGQRCIFSAPNSAMTVATADLRELPLPTNSADERHAACDGPSRRSSKRRASTFSARPSPG